MSPVIGRMRWSTDVLRRAAVDIVFPPRCAGCRRRGYWVCPECDPKVERIEPPFCVRCGHPIDAACRCDQLTEALDMLRSAAWYEGWIKTAIISFKYEGERARASHLANLLVPLIEQYGVDATLVPVPLHKDRERSRGFNQSRELARLSGVNTVVREVLVRPVATLRQVGLPAAKRAQNVRGAFTLAPGVDVRGQRFVLIDDVKTTGATLSECATVLKAAGAAWVGAFTVARER